MDATRYCALPITFHRCGEDHAVLCLLRDRRRVVVSFKAACVLRWCQLLRTREGHEKEAVQALRSIHGDLNVSDFECGQIVDQLISSGLMISESSLVDLRSQVSAACNTVPPLCDIAIPTSERPAQLERCIYSIIENTIGREKPFTLTVYEDNDTEADGAERLSRMLRSLRHTGALSVRYSNRWSRAQFARRLAREAGVDPQIVEFAINANGANITTGANRNSALLDLEGLKFLFVDDDIVARTYHSQKMETGVALDSSRRPVKTRVFENVGAAEASLVRLDTDILTLHNEHLGTSIGGKVFPLRDRSRVQCEAALWQSALEGTGRISATQMGIVGDSGQSSPTWLLNARESERSASFEEGCSYAQARISRQATRVADMLTISSSSYCMSYALGLDNGEDLPPFLPIGRNSDGVFGAFLRTGIANRYIAHLPYAVLHNREDGSPYGREAIWRDAARVRISDIVIGMLQECRSAFIDGTWRSVGTHFVEMGRYKENDFAEILRQIASSTLRRRVAEYEMLLKKFDRRPKLWAEDVEKAKEHILQSVARKELGLPSDFSPGDWGGRVRKVRELISYYGTLIESWKALRKAARTLRVKRGESILSRQI